MQLTDLTKFVDREELMPTDDIHPLECPHCGFKQQWHEPDTQSGQMIQCRCEECGESFYYSVTVTRQYWSYKDYDEYWN